MLVDFHLHSLLSDGLHSPEIVFILANKYNVKFISLTDHDTILGNTEAQKIARQLNLNYIPGVELQADITKISYEHILAYGIKDYTKISSYLEKLRNERIANIIQNIKILNDLGYSIDLETIDCQTPGRHLTESHVKKWLKENSIIPNSPLNLHQTYHFYPEIINLIHECGGIAVLAHPFRYNQRFNTDLDFMKSYIKILVNAGLDGIEAYYATHSPKQISICEHISDLFKLIKTGGSDWHGWNDEATIGVKVNQKNIENFLDICLS